MPWSYVLSVVCGNGMCESVLWKCCPRPCIALQCRFVALNTNYFIYSRGIYFREVRCWWIWCIMHSWYEFCHNVTVCLHTPLFLQNLEICVYVCVYGCAWVCAQYFESIKRDMCCAHNHCSDQVCSSLGTLIPSLLSEDFPSAFFDLLMWAGGCVFLRCLVNDTPCLIDNGNVH